MWNWQHRDWPNFQFDSTKLEPLEREFARSAGSLEGVLKHLETDDKNGVIVHILSTEALKTSEIEGEFLNRESVQSSIRRNLGLSTNRRKVQPAEAGIAELITYVYTQYQRPLSHTELHHWNAELLQGRRDLETIGSYRKHVEPMQVVSGVLGMETVHFEAPASKVVALEMKGFLEWFNSSLHKLPPLTRSGIAHLYSVSIHPYEDGNGRMARALAEKVLSQELGYPALSGLSRQIVNNKKAYYDALERNNHQMDITDWLVYIAQTTLDAHSYTLSTIERVIQKAQVYKQFQHQLNERQIKVLNKMFEAEPEGFAGGLSANNYLSITKTSRATATRDLQKLVDMGVLQVRGTLRFARYYLVDCL
jgi:Fic family protein